MMLRKQFAGMGDAVPLNTWCDQASAWNPLAYLLCLPHDVAHVYDQAGQAAGAAYSDFRYGTVNGQPTIPMPAPPPPGVTLTADPSAATNPNAIYGGTINGTAYYAVPQTAQQNMDAFKATVGDYFNQVGAAADAAACSHFYSMLDPTCPGQYIGTVPILIAVGVVAFMLFRGSRR
jgi:hypothetical protein